MKHFKIVLCISLLIIACESPEGEGGNSSISGVLYTSYYNDDFSELLYTELAADEDVFIIYGTDEFYGDDIETMYDGTFKFDYLRKGDYTLYFYSDDTVDVNSDTEIPIVKNVTISGRKEAVNVGDVYRKEKLSWDDGGATIKGQIYSVNYYDFSEWPILVVKDTAVAQEHEVYLTYGDHSVYDERIRTHYDGSFEFKSLIKGNYDIYVYSDNVTGASEDSVIHKEVIITDMNAEVNVGDIFIDQL